MARMSDDALDCVQPLLQTCSRNAQRSDAAFVSTASKLHLPPHPNPIILAAKAGRQPGGRPPFKLPP
jgi:hypothetical protein